MALVDSDLRVLEKERLDVYVDNVFGTIGDYEDFTWLLPAILRHWAKELDCDNWKCKYVESVHRALRWCGFLQDQLASHVRSAVVSFMRTALLRHIGNESTLVFEGEVTSYRWMGNFAAYGVIVDDVPKLWDAWWSLPTIGHAITTVQYASCLICAASRNPVYPTVNGSPSAPGLWDPYVDSSGSLDWQSPNIKFLRTTLTPEYLGERLKAARHLYGERLANIPEILLKQMGQNSDQVSRRIDFLIEMLAKEMKSPLAKWPE